MIQKFTIGNILFESNDTLARSYVTFAIGDVIKGFRSSDTRVFISGHTLNRAGDSSVIRSGINIRYNIRVIKIYKYKRLMKTVTCYIKLYAHVPP